MTRKSKRELERAVEDLGGSATDRLPEFCFGAVTLVSQPAPELSDGLAAQGFVVGREYWPPNDVPVGVNLTTAPPVADVFLPAVWYWEGPTAPIETIRVCWDSKSAVERAATDLDGERTMPATDHDQTDADVELVAGEEWTAVAPPSETVTNMIVRRSAAERCGYEILGAVPSTIPDAETYDLVEVDAEPVPYSERRPVP